MIMDFHTTIKKEKSHFSDRKIVMKDIILPNYHYPYKMYGPTIVPSPVVWILSAFVKVDLVIHRVYYRLYVNVINLEDEEVSTGILNILDTPLCRRSFLSALSASSPPLILDPSTLRAKISFVETESYELLRSCCSAPSHNGQPAVGRSFRLSSAPPPYFAPHGVRSCDASIPAPNAASAR